MRTNAKKSRHSLAWPEAASRTETHFVRRPSATFQFLSQGRDKKSKVYGERQSVRFRRPASPDIPGGRRRGPASARHSVPVEMRTRRGPAMNLAGIFFSGECQGDGPEPRPGPHGRAGLEGKETDLGPKSPDPAVVLAAPKSKKNLSPKRATVDLIVI
ncbi:hypothetical protein GWI33_016582 [Rhynchophorus ferrugineus]|uniref:Uncharacterized protein n=1 Tax=Rhynchophorus ferrugineus TaxID=354439 RepID=A0A834IAT9_RHYFE|nr:hypothetical protein GWI33_016582 [Rhynchophorus ferrugineus]